MIYTLLSANPNVSNTLLEALGCNQ